MCNNEDLLNRHTRQGVLPYVSQSESLYTSGELFVMNDFIMCLLKHIPCAPYLFGVQYSILKAMQLKNYKIITALGIG